MADTRGTFRLHTVRQDVLNNEYVPIPSVWTLAALDDAGYIAGGNDEPGPYNSRYDKIAYSTDTKSTLTAVLSGNIAARGGASSPTAGYTMGGLEPSSPAGKTSKIDKLTYATSTNSQLTGTLDDSQTWGSAGGGSSTAGYLCGGYNPDISDIRKVTYATDTIETLPANVSNPAGPNYNMGSAGNADDFLYLIGGASGTGNEAKKFTYSNESCSNIPTMPSPGSHNRSQKAGCSSSSLAAYINGGSNPTWNAINKTTFSNDTTSYVTNSTTLRMQLAGTGSPSAGYFAGGSDLSITERITMSTESNARVPALDLTINGKRQTGISAKQDNRGAPNPTRWIDGATETGNKMYCIGPGTAHDTFNMTTETAASLSLPGMPSLDNGASAQNTTHSYIHAGSPGKQTKVRKITWSTDTATTLPGTTSRPAENKSGTGNETKGYFTQGGSSPGPCYSGSDRVTYASDTIERVPGADMVGGRPGKFGAQATGNQDTGYFMGGGGEWPGFPNYSDTNKLTYATDTNANCPAQMPTGMSMYAGSSASSSTAAYASNYRNPSFHSKVFKLVFATDTVDTVGNTTVQRNGPAMGGNGTTMYMGGGSNFPNGDRSDFDKLVYATDTFSNLPDANLQSARYYTTGSGQRGERIPIAEPPVATPTASTFPSVNPALNVNAVFAAGAGPSSSTNQRSKLTFSNETMASMPSFADSQNTFGGASSTTRGYLSGSFGNTSLGDTQNKRWYNQYSNDTSGLLPSRTSQNAGGMYSMNDETKLYSGGGGWSGGQYNTAESMPFANETNTGEPGMTLTSPKKFASGIGNKTIGFVCGGNEGNNNRTTIDKVVYSTGTMSTSPSNLTLSGASPYHATMAVGNRETGFIFQSSPTNKLVFATETVSSAPNNNTATSWGNATSSATTGYCTNHPSGQYLIKYVFSTETTGTLPGMFSPNRGRAGAMSTAMFGGAYTSIRNVI